MEENKNNMDKARIFIMMVIALAVLFSAVLMLAAAGADNWSPLLWVTVIIVGIQVGVLVWVVKRSADVKAGFPLHDERSKRVMDKASSRSFYFMIYFLLAIGWVADDGIESIGMGPIIAWHATAAGILGGAIVFFIMAAYYSQKADV